MISIESHAGIEPHAGYGEDGAFSLEWIVGRQGQDQIRFGLTIEPDRQISWYFVARLGTELLDGSGYLPPEFSERIINGWLSKTLKEMGL